MIIIGITGTLGAGKGTVVDYLVRKRNFKHYSVRKFIAKYIKRQGKEINRDSLVEMGNKLREKYGPSYLADQIYKLAKKSRKNCVIESLRTEAEIKSLRNKGKFYLLAVDAKAKLRFKRIVARGGATDRIDYQEFVRNERRELHTTDPTKQNLNRCIEIADSKIVNNGTINELNKKVDQIIQRLLINTTL